MASSLSNLVGNLADKIHKIKCKDCDCFLEYEHVKDNQNTFKFPNNGINKSILLLRKGVYPYEYMDEWEKFDETKLPQKEEFYSNLNMEHITDADHIHAKRVCK